MHGSVCTSSCLIAATLPKLNFKLAVQSHSTNSAALTGRIFGWVGGDDWFVGWLRS